MKAALATAFSVLCLVSVQAAPIKVLLIDGQNNHDWKSTSPVLKQQLEDAGIFKVDVATAPASGTADFKPHFSDYQVVVSNYNGEPWSDATKKDFENFVSNGGGFVAIHAADNAFPEWLAYNEMIGLGGWGGRNEKSGPMLRLRDGKWVPDNSPGPGGHHGAMHEFVIVSRFPDHPIMKGLPEKWMHANDELYDCLRGPAKHVHVLGSAFSAKEHNGSGEEEPLIMIIPFGKGRVFHTTLGHDVRAIKCIGFETTYTRGTEWAATGKVTLKVPEHFPTEGKSSSRP